MDYRQSGVDIDAGNETVRRIKSLARGDVHARRAVRDRIVRRAVPARSRRLQAIRCWSSSADGVGTKLKVAFMTGRHDTVGADLVNHCVNDILVQGARAAVLPRLPGDRAAVAGRRRAGRRRHRARVPRERLRADRRRDGGDARLLCRRRIRHRRLHRRRRRRDARHRRPDDSCPATC